MTSIAFGGGPTLEQRRAFAGLKDGTHVPGYRGYCPQLKYRMGKTYGQDTHELSQGSQSYQTPSTASTEASQRQTTIHLQPVDPNRPRHAHPILHEPPVQATGNNPYPRKMIPGYTGYIPTLPFRYGGTFKVMSDEAVQDYTSAMQKRDSQQQDLEKNMTCRQSTLQAVRFDPEVKDRLDRFRDTHPNQSSLQESKREFLEPPIPGYMGYITKLNPTEYGLGARYHRTTGRSLDAFVKENEQHFRVLQQPVILNPNTVPGSAPARGASSGSQGRLYQNDGMIPKYTGYLPQE